jgi:hypothetical protein
MSWRWAAAMRDEDDDAEFARMKARLGKAPTGDPVQSARPAVIPFLVTRAGVQQRGLPIFLDNPTLDEEGKRQVYAVLMCIPWLAPQIRSAIAKYGLGRSVEQDEHATAKLQAKIFHDAIDRYKARFESMGVRRYTEAAYQRLAWLTGIKVKALKQFLYRHPRD